MKYIGDYDTLRPFIRYIALGCYHKDYLTRKLGLSPRSYEENLSRLRFFLPSEKLQTLRQGHKEIHALKGDLYRPDALYLAKTYQTKALKPKAAFYLFGLLQILAAADEPLDETTILQYRLTPTDKALPSGINDLSRSTLNRYLKELVNLGLAERCMFQGRYFYKSRQNPLAGLNGIETRQLRAAVNFYAHIAPLSMPGLFLDTYLADTCPASAPPCNLSQIKHIPPDKLLDEEIISLLLQAIDKQAAVSFQYGGRETAALPLKLLINRYEGRQYLEALAKAPSARHYSQKQTFRLDLVQNLRPAGHKSKEPPSYAPSPLHELRLTFRTNSPGEAESIRQRISKRFPSAAFTTKAENFLCCTIQLQDDLSLAPWLRTFYPSLCLGAVSSKVLQERLLEDLKEMMKNYGLHTSVS